MDGIETTTTTIAISLPPLPLDPIVAAGEVGATSAEQEAAAMGGQQQQPLLSQRSPRRQLRSLPHPPPVVVKPLNATKSFLKLTSKMSHVGSPKFETAAKNRQAAAIQRRPPPSRTTTTEGDIPLFATATATARLTSTAASTSSRMHAQAAIDCSKPQSRAGGRRTTTSTSGADAATAVSSAPVNGDAAAAVVSTTAPSRDCTPRGGSSRGGRVPPLLFNPNHQFYADKPKEERALSNFFVAQRLVMTPGAASAVPILSTSRMSSRLSPRSHQPNHHPGTPQTARVGTAATATPSGGGGGGGFFPRPPGTASEGSPSRVQTAAQTARPTRIFADTVDVEGTAYVQEETARFEVDTLPGAEKFVKSQQPLSVRVAQHQNELVRLLFQLRLSLACRLTTTICARDKSDLRREIASFMTRIGLRQLGVEDFHMVMQNVLRDPDMPIAESKVIFDLFDTNRSTVVDPEELSEGIELVGLSEERMTLLFLRKLFHELRNFRDTQLSFYEVQLLIFGLLVFYKCDFPLLTIRPVGYISPSTRSHEGEGHDDPDHRANKQRSGEEEEEEQEEDFSIIKHIMKSGGKGAKKQAEAPSSLFEKLKAKQKEELLEQSRITANDVSSVADTMTKQAKSVLEIVWKHSHQGQVSVPLLRNFVTNHAPLLKEAIMALPGSCIPEDATFVAHDEELEAEREKEVARLLAKLHEDLVVKDIMWGSHSTKSNQLRQKVTDTEKKKQKEVLHANSKGMALPPRDLLPGAFRVPPAPPPPTAVETTRFIRETKPRTDTGERKKNVTRGNATTATCTASTSSKRKKQDHHHHRQETSSSPQRSGSAARSLNEQITPFDAVAYSDFLQAFAEEEAAFSLAASGGGAGTPRGGRQARGGGGRRRATLDSVPTGGKVYPKEGAVNKGSNGLSAEDSKKLLHVPVDVSRRRSASRRRGGESPAPQGGGNGDGEDENDMFGPASRFAPLPDKMDIYHERFRADQAKLDDHDRQLLRAPERAQAQWFTLRGQVWVRNAENGEEHMVSEGGGSSSGGNP